MFSNPILSCSSVLVVAVFVNNVNVEVVLVAGVSVLCSVGIGDVDSKLVPSIDAVLAVSILLSEFVALSLDVKQIVPSTRVDVNTGFTKNLDIFLTATGGLFISVASAFVSLGIAVSSAVAIESVHADGMFMLFSLFSNVSADVDDVIVLSGV